MSETDQIAKRLEMEMKQLLIDIERVEPRGEPRCTFGSLFDDEQAQNYYEALAGTLKAAKKKNLVQFDSPILLKGIHDKIVLSINNDEGREALNQVKMKLSPDDLTSSNTGSDGNDGQQPPVESPDKPLKISKKNSPGKEAYSFLRMKDNDGISGEETKTDRPSNSTSANEEKATTQMAKTAPVPEKILNSNPSEEGCYLLFDESSGGTMKIQYSKKKVHGALGFWRPGHGKKIQAFKFNQNQGRSDLLKGIAGKDYRKKYFSAVAQFVKAARMQSGTYCKWSEFDRVENDVYVFYNNTCEVKHIKEGEYFDVAEIDAIAVVPKGNSTFVGVHTGEYGVFLGRGDAAGASLPIFNH